MRKPQSGDLGEKTKIFQTKKKKKANLDLGWYSVSGKAMSFINQGSYSKSLKIILFSVCENKLLCVIFLRLNFSVCNNVIIRILLDDREDDVRQRI